MLFMICLLLTTISQSLLSRLYVVSRNAELCRVDDEHRLIARYAARLAADENKAVSSLYNICYRKSGNNVTYHSKEIVHVICSCDIL